MGDAHCKCYPYGWWTGAVLAVNEVTVHVTVEGKSAVSWNVRQGGLRAGQGERVFLLSL